MSTVTRASALATLLFAFLCYRSSPFRRNALLLFISNDVGVFICLKLARVLLGYLIPPILIHFWYKWPTHVAQDGRQCLEHIQYIRRTRYGPHIREELDELHPIDFQKHHDVPKLNPSGIVHLLYDVTFEVFEFVAFGLHLKSPPKEIGIVRKDAPAILFGHGGGWVVDGTDVQLGQLPPLARAGYSIFTFNYQLAPEDPFPGSVISTLRAMSYLKTHRGYNKIAMLGESAGGNLVVSCFSLFYCV